MLLATLLLLLSSSADPSGLPPGEGKAIVERACISCHAAKVVTSKRATKEQWSTLVDQMMSRGAELNDDEVEIVVDYLAKNFGADKPPAEDEKNHGKTAPEKVNKSQTSANLGLSARPYGSVVSSRKENIVAKELRDPTTQPAIDISKTEYSKSGLAF